MCHGSHGGLEVGREGPAFLRPQGFEGLGFRV